MPLETRIIGFDLWHLEVPVVSRRDHGIGSIEGGFEVIVLRLTAEDGTCGWGEAACWSVFTGTPEASYAALDRYLRPLVLGQPVSARAEIMAKSLYAVAHATEAKAALEAALMDLEGKLRGLPVYDLLGGKTMERIREDGITLVKLKTGFKDHAFDMMRCARIREDFPQFGLRIDYNQGLETAEAEARVLDIAGFAPDFIRCRFWPMRASLAPKTWPAPPAKASPMGFRSR